MTLSEYVATETAARGGKRGVLSDLARASGVSYVRLHQAVAGGRAIVKRETAQAISTATGGKVSVDELLDRANFKRRRKRKRAPARRRAA